MKKILLLILCLSFSSFAQQKSKTKANPKTNIPLIKDKPKTTVPILTDKDELLEIKSNEPNPNDLLDISLSVPKPKTPNAGQQIYNEIGLNGDFTFNKKIGFSVNAPEGNLVSYFYLNTKNGYSMLDWKGIKAMLSENPEGEMTQIKNANNDFYQYIKSSEGNFVMKAGSKQSMVVHDIQTEMLSKEFFKTFKKTGNKVGKVGGNKYPRVEYSGTFEGKKMSIWLSNPQDVLLDTKFTHSLSGYWGLGFIASPSGTTYMITGIVGDGASIFMNYIENATVSFSGKGYKPMGEMTGGNAGAFSQTSDIQDLPFVDQINNADATANYYDIMISALNQSIVEHQSGLNEAQKNNDVTAIKRHNCLITCTKNEKTRLEKVKSEHIKIINQYKNDDEKRDEKINQLMETQGQPKPCNC